MRRLFTNAHAIVQYKHATQTLTFELNYERSARAVECVSKDEDIRRLRFQLLLLEDENDELNNQLAEEEARVEDLEQSVIDALSQLDRSESNAQRLNNELRLKARDLDNMKVSISCVTLEFATNLGQLEFSSLQNTTADSAKLLTEKLTLTREISTMKPELEHLRAQCASQQGLLAEKLSLQRQLSTIQVELENEKRAGQRLATKESRQGELEHESQSERDGLRKELNKTKRELEKAQKAADKAQSDLEREVAKAEQGTKSAEDTNGGRKQDRKDENLRKEVEQEKKRREEAEKAFQRSQQQWEAKQTLLDEKLDAFRTKLRATKEKLKDTETQLQNAQTSAVSRPPAPEKQERAAKRSRKRTAASVDPDVTIGTPGDLPKKRTKLSSTLPGDKSTFSITPFLNRTASVAPESPAGGVDGEAAENEDPAEYTPSAPPKEKPRQTAAAKTKPLGTSKDVANGKVPNPRRRPTVSMLEKVTEEGDEEDQENKAPEEAQKAGLEKLDLIPKLKPTSMQPRKSLASFAAFNEEPAPEKKKKRKLLGGGLGKTLFDEDDGAAPTKPIPGKGLFGGRILGRAGAGTKGSGAIKGSFMMTTDDGFQFSPLKKDRKVALAK